MNRYYVYFMSNKNNNVLYVGVTNDLNRRVSEHKGHILQGFTDRYNCEKLVYFEEFTNILEAIAREKQFKNWKREWKNKIISDFNPSWIDLLEK